MGDVVEFKPYVPVIDELESRLDELPEWCRDAVGHLINMSRMGAHFAKERGETLDAIRAAIDSCRFMPPKKETK